MGVLRGLGRGRFVVAVGRSVAIFRILWWVVAVSFYFEVLMKA